MSRKSSKLVILVNPQFLEKTELVKGKTSSEKTITGLKGKKFKK